MYEKVQLLMTEGDQMVRLPQDCRFENPEIYIHRDSVTGDVILSSRPPLSWDEFLEEDVSEIVPADFMSQEERQQGKQERDPFAGFDV
ncbi:antitoxin [Rugamonas aquatica]|uniref:AbrB/MazE/SpoVT family DNA-binding domain-containing protein n=1 Tax=Rugamonas aquatica TaxID=2743357 RepID=A0A6A7MXS1_9BURK|nr:AbrB/MazE/SpoVT family DNA-binding domain-containing protein [Rugamonas aquatica]MQA37539.1 AbrB/MazE/SpoVT family DNA-binding domain-containing protein [Rugamonas aquatica]